MAKAKQNTASLVRGLITDTVEGLGYELWDVEYVKDGAFWYLRITIDSEKGIDIDDCERVHRAIDPIIDEADPIEDQYYLEVSSPGIERELRTTEHLKRYIGSKVCVKLFTALDGQKQFVGELLSCDDGSITVETGGEKKIERKDVSRITLYYDYDNEPDGEIDTEGER